MQEKISLPNKRNELLKGVLNNGRSLEPMIIFVHGFAGNKEENGLFVEAENYFTSRNINTFRYDMAGIGESSGDYSKTSLVEQAQDLELVVQTMRKMYHENNISVVGFSLGAAVSTLINQKLVDQYIFWSPSLFMATDMYPRYSTEDVVNELKSKGYLDKGGVRVGRKIIDEFRKFDPVPLLMGINKPVLLIHGTEDPRIDYRNTIAATQYLKNSTFIKIDGANHSYKNNQLHRNELFEETYSWLEREIKK
jgi:uncharacterized protein